MKVEKVELVSAFAKDDAILLTCGAKLKEIAKSVRGQLATLNIPPSAPPAAPRLLLRYENVIFQVGLARFAALVEPDDESSTSYERAISFSLERTRNVFESLASANLVQYEWTGVVSVLAFPQDMRTYKNLEDVSALAMR